MKRSIYLTGLSLFLAFCSCVKDPDENRIYRRAEFVEGEVRLFVKSGEVKDKQVIAKFAEGVRSFFLDAANPPAYVYAFADDEQQFEAYDLELRFASASTGVLRYNAKDGGKPEEWKFKLEKRAGYDVISMLDTLHTFYFSENPRYQCSPVVLKREPLPMAGEMVTYLRPLYVKKSKDSVALCLVSYMEKRYYQDELSLVHISGVTNNLINPSYLSGLGNTPILVADTFAYKESYILFR